MCSCGFASSRSQQVIKLLVGKLGGKLLLVKMPIAKTSPKLRKDLVIVKLREALVGLEVVLLTADLQAFDEDLVLKAIVLKAAAADLDAKAVIEDLLLQALVLACDLQAGLVDLVLEAVAKGLVGKAAGSPL